MISNSHLYRTLIKKEESSFNLVAFYSLRKLSGYSGSAIRVRRSSDNSEQDIGFIGSVLDTTSLLSFVGSNNGYVTKWYEQTGLGNDLFNTSTTEQPLIVSSGVLNTSGGQECVYFDGVDDRLVEVSPYIDFTTNGQFSVFSVFEPKVINPGTNHVLIHVDRFTPRVSQIFRISGSKPQMISFNTTGNSFTNTNNTTLSINTKYVSSSIRRQNDIEIYLNGSSILPTTTTGTARNKTTILEIGRRLTSEAFNGNAFEFKIYNGDLDNTSKQNVENEIISYYGI